MAHLLRSIRNIKPEIFAGAIHPKLTQGEREEDEPTPPKGENSTV